MWQLITKLTLVLVALTGWFLITTTPVKADAPDVDGYVLIENTNTPVAGVWIRWVDNLGHIRYAFTDSNGHYLFPSWQRINGDTEYNNIININVDGTACNTSNIDNMHCARQSNVDSSVMDAFGCLQNPHVFSVVTPIIAGIDYGSNGVFKPIQTVDLQSINNAVATQTNSTIYYASCNVLWSNVPATPLSGSNFTATITQNGSSIGDWNNVMVYMDGPGYPLKPPLSTGGTPYTPSPPASPYYTWDIPTDSASLHRLFFYVHSTDAGYTDTSQLATPNILCNGDTAFITVNPSCSVTSAACGSATTNSVTINNITRTDNGWGSTGYYVQSSGLPNRFLLDPINSYTATGLTANTSHTFNISCAYQYGMGGYQTTGTFPLSCSTSANPPTINSLQINNASSTTFTSTQQKTIGLASGQGGLGWRNPMKVTLNTTQGSNPVTNSYVIFYDQTLGSASSFNNALSNIDQNPVNGFALAYGQNINPADSGNNFYVRSGGAWVKITGVQNGQAVCGSSGCATQKYYTVWPGDYYPGESAHNNLDIPNTWTVRVENNFAFSTGIKNFFTAAYATDNTVSTFVADCTESNNSNNCKLIPY